MMKALHCFLSAQTEQRRSNIRNGGFSLVQFCGKAGEVVETGQSEMVVPGANRALPDSKPERRV